MPPQEGKTVHAVGVDIGGTFTDAVLLLHDHSTVIGKAFTTTNDPTVGALAAIEGAARSISQTLGEALANAQWLSHGTTVGLNAVLTGTGAKVGPADHRWLRGDAADRQSQQHPGAR